MKLFGSDVRLGLTGLAEEAGDKTAESTECRERSKDSLGLKSDSAEGATQSEGAERVANADGVVEAAGNGDAGESKPSAEGDDAGNSDSADLELNEEGTSEWCRPLRFVNLAESHSWTFAAGE